MEISALVGFLIGMFSLLFAVVTSGGAWQAYFHVPSLVCVGGGAIAAVLMCFPLGSVLTIPRTLRKAAFAPLADLEKLSATLVQLAEVARRDGLLALESRVEEVDDPFLAVALELAVDGTPPEIIESTLRARIETAGSRDRESRAVIDALGRYAPAFGMIGTLLGLVTMLGNMANPAAIGPGMAVALITTLYGTVLANLVTLPLAERLAHLHRHEREAMELTLRGVLAIQAGDNPRLIEQRLGVAHIPFPRIHSDSRRAA